MQNNHPKNKPKSAVGLTYTQEQGSAPTVVAKGFGDLAEDIISLAKEHGILIHEDAELSQFLSTLDLGLEIPDELYHVIAELIAFSYVLQGKFPDSWGKSHGKVSKQV